MIAQQQVVKLNSGDVLSVNGTAYSYTAPTSGIYTVSVQMVQSGPIGITYNVNSRQNSYRKVRNGYIVNIKGEEYVVLSEDEANRLLKLALE